jgi:hypothetical protein
MKVILLLLELSIGSAGLLTVDVDRSTGSYGVSLDGSMWLSSAPIRYGVSSASLALLGVTNVTGSDIHGSFVGVQTLWGTDKPVFETTIKSFIGGAYTSTLLKFEQRWLDAVKIEQQWLVGDSHVLAAFPSFLVHQEPSSEELNFISWGGCQVDANTIGKFHSTRSNQVRPGPQHCSQIDLKLNTQH